MTHPTRKILVVDDEVLIGMEVEMVLSDAGYSVLGPATSLEQAHALLDGSLPDAAVLDVKLADDTSQSIADRLAQADVPFLFLTGYSVENMPNSHKGRPVINKPFLDHELLKMLRGIVH